MGEEAKWSPSYRDLIHAPSPSGAEALGRDPALKTWTFATDGRFYVWSGIPVIGFGPGEERFAHTHQDHVSVDDYLRSITAYAWVACMICGVR
jgi:acetylornithine deacetylase/succinyl-diaminopimelate desuccinylase-like protein